MAFIEPWPTAGGRCDAVLPTLPVGGYVCPVSEEPLAGMLARQVLDAPELQWLAPLAREYLKREPDEGR